MAREDHERVLRAVIRAGWPDREPTWPAFLKAGAVLCVTDARTTTGCPGPCAPPSPTGATARGTYRRRSPNPHASGGAGDGCAQRQWTGVQQAGPWTTDNRHGGMGADQRRGTSPRPARAPHDPAVRTAGGHTPPRVGVTAGTTHAQTEAPLTRRPLTTNR